MINSYVSSSLLLKTPKKPQTPVGYAYFLGQDNKALYESLIEQHALDWQTEALLSNDKEMAYFSGKNGPVWILKPRETKTTGHWGLMRESTYAWSRDMGGALLGYFRAHQLKTVFIELVDSDADQEMGLFVGLDMAAYNFREIYEKKKTGLPQLVLTKKGTAVDTNLMKQAQIQAQSINIARHLVNLPPNDLNPSTYKNYLSQMKFGKSTKIEIWNEARLKKEGCGLHLAVGQGSPNPPCLIRISYRPAKKSGAPVAFVGKGITFDTGGLDIKPSAGMRLMKKDMGGAAAVTALAYWVSQARPKTACDFYLALAENSLDGNSFRPSDVVVARSGLRVEIDNTDAEGRLVLADALDVAVTQKGSQAPDTVINVATLTGAIKVALGADMAGLFSNDDELADQLLQSAQGQGDYIWRMPLVEKYFASLSSPFADFKNSADGFGGAITAALFLQKLVKGKKWAHLDIYAWADKASGALASTGGSGQIVQCLIDYIKNRE